MSASSTNPHRLKTWIKDVSLDDIPAGAPPRPGREGEAVVRRVDRASPNQDKITRAEELRLQLADEIGRGARRDRHPPALQRVAHPGARGAAPARRQRPGRCEGASRPGGGAALDR